MSELPLGGEIGWRLIESAPDAMVVVDDGGTIVLVNAQLEALFKYGREELLGRSIDLLVPESVRPSHAAMRARYGVNPHPRAMGVGLVLHGRTATGEEVPVEISLSPLATSVGTFTVAAVRDVTERRLAEESLRVSETRVRELVRESNSWIWAVNPEGVLLATEGHLEGLPLVAPLDVGRSVRELFAGSILTVPVIESALSGTHCAEEVRAAGRVYQITCNPIHDADGRLIEVVGIATDLTARVRSEQEARAADAARRLVADRERIARDLHDTVIQRLFAAGMALQASIPLVDSERLSSRLEAIVDDLDETIREIRTTIFRLESTRPIEQPSGLRARILELVGEYAGPLGFEPAVEFQGPVDAASITPVEPHLLAVVRESLSNCARHADATRVTVRVVAQAEFLDLRIEDNGVGIDPESPGRGNGLPNLLSRAAELGGLASVEPTPTGGTTVTWRVPLTPAD